MPAFECSECGAIASIPLASCEWTIGNIPVARIDPNQKPIYRHRCAHCSLLRLEIVDGDLLDQDVEVIVNPWNRNIIPWWLLLPQGVSGAIKRRAGYLPFRELARYGPIPLGGAVLTSAGRLGFKGIIHVAGINMLWRASERSIRDSVANALRLAHERGFQSLAFPLIGAGTGGFSREKVIAIMQETASFFDLQMSIKIVRYRA